MQVKFRFFTGFSGKKDYLKRAFQLTISIFGSRSVKIQLQSVCTEGCVLTILSANLEKMGGIHFVKVDSWV
jgi:hypothetical protein